MTNKYLEKIAASFKDEGDAAKTFAQASAGGWAAHIAGGAVGAAGLGLLAAKNKRVGDLARRAIQAGEKYTAKAQATRAGRFVKQHLTGGGHAAIAGGVLGGYGGEELANYAAIRHGVLKAKKDGRQDG